MKRIIFSILLVFGTCFAIAQDTPPTKEATTEVTAQPDILTEQEAPKQLELTPAQALEILARAAGEYKGTLEEHMILREAVVTIAKSLGLDKQPATEVEK